MKRHHPEGSRLSGKQPGLQGGQVMPLPCPFTLFIEKRRLDEEIVGAPGEIDDLCRVCRSVGGVGDVGDLLSGNDVQDHSFQFPERVVSLFHPCRTRPPGPKRRVVSIPPRDCQFQLREPGAGRQTQLQQPVFHDVHMALLLQGKGQGDGPVVQERGAYAKRLLVQEEAVRQLLRPLVFPPEAAAAVKLGNYAAAVRMEFGGNDGEVGGIALHQVPGKGGESVLYLGGEAGRTEKVETFFAAETETQHLVEADEVVDVGMGDEDVGESQYFPGGEGADVSQVEQERPSLVEEIDIYPRVVKGTVDQAWQELGGHGTCTICCRSLLIDQAAEHGCCQYYQRRIDPGQSQYSKGRHNDEQFVPSQCQCPCQTMFRYAEHCQRHVVRGPDQQADNNRTNCLQHGLDQPALPYLVEVDHHDQHQQGRRQHRSGGSGNGSGYSGQLVTDEG